MIERTASVREQLGRSLRAVDTLHMFDSHALLTCSAYFPVNRLICAVQDVKDSLKNVVCLE